MIALTPAHVDAALRGDKAAVRALVDALTPVIHARVARSLLRRQREAKQRDIRQEVEDMTQEVFVALFADEGRVLREWKPERGLSLMNFAGLVAEREVASILRSGKRSPWKEDPTLHEGLEAHAEASESRPSTPVAEAAFASRELLANLLDRLRARLSPLGLHLFTLLYVQELPVDEVCSSLGMTADAVYAWRSRLTKLIGELGREITSESVSKRAPVLRIPLHNRTP